MRADRQLGHAAPLFLELAWHSIAPACHSLCLAVFHCSLRPCHLACRCSPCVPPGSWDVPPLYSWSWPRLRGLWQPSSRARAYCPCSSCSWASSTLMAGWAPSAGTVHVGCEACWQPVTGPGPAPYVAPAAGLSAPCCKGGSLLLILHTGHRACVHGHSHRVELANVFTTQGAVQCM